MRRGNLVTNRDWRRRYSWGCDPISRGSRIRPGNARYGGGERRNAAEVVRGDRDAGTRSRRYGGMPCCRIFQIAGVSGPGIESRGDAWRVRKNVDFRACGIGTRTKPADDIERIRGNGVRRDRHSNRCSVRAEAVACG